jgi:hypothetical protein
MLRIHGDRDSLLAALMAHWADQQLQIPQALRPVVAPTSSSETPKRIERPGLSIKVARSRHKTGALQCGA